MKKKRGAAQPPLRDPPGPDGQSPALAAQTDDDAPPIEQAMATPLEPTGRLYTQCPQCQTTYRITVAQLRRGRGEALCQQCQAGFNVLDALAETTTRARPGPAAPASQPPLLGRLEAVGTREPVLIAAGDGPSALSAADLKQDDPAAGDEIAPSEKNRSSRATRLAWGAGVAALSAMLMAQLGVFEGPQLAQNERLRAGLEAACQTLGCRLPPFRAPALIQIIDQTLSPAPDGIDGYEFTLVLANQASLPQPFPAVKLTLDAHNGSAAAVRVFQPEEYLPADAPKTMAAGELQEIRLLLAKPRQEVGGFSFELQ